MKSRLPAIAATLAAGPGGGYAQPMTWWSWGMFLGPVLMIAAIAAIVAIVVFIIRGSGGGAAAAAPAKTPLDILDERFARGEIEKEEFEEKRRLLGK
ncbi:MAG TPA: hypothetical protein ENI55_00430 [Alphaproteobacteria bacterium]|nr:hypothetical protein [Alphaproteobacteria bacterium]